MLQHNQREAEYLHQVEKERYALLNPVVKYLRWNNTNIVDSRYGHINTTKQYDEPIEVHADYSWDKKVKEKEHKHGIWITTNRVEIFLCYREISDLGIVLKLGDVIDFMTSKHEILSIQSTDLITGSQYDCLHYVVIVDTKQTIEVE